MVVEVIRGDLPVVLGQPHGSTDVPPEIWVRLNPRGKELADTDWHIARLYDGLLPEASVVRAQFHRYVIDANRDPTGASLYAGQATTGLVPETGFDGAPIWSDPLTPEDSAERLATYHAPYHAALEAEMTRVAARHGWAILYDCHSIRSHVPNLFEGALPVLNIGTNNGASCATEIEAVVHDLASASGLDTVLNGRFKGGWTTRHYGRPGQGWHGVQMEIAQRAYLTGESPPWTYDDAKAAKLRAVLEPILTSLARWRPA